MAQEIFDIQLINHQRHYECNPKDSILEGALSHGLSMHHECSNGTCGACKAILVRGEIEKSNHHDFLITEEQKVKGEFLMCCNVPISDVAIEVDLIGDVKSIPIQSIDTKVKSIQFTTQDLAVLTLKTPRSKTLQFMAGQDVLLSYDDRHYSRYPLASCPCNGRELEFHIRNIRSDPFALALFDRSVNVKSVINLEGPKGIFVLNEASDRPMIFIAWDSGFAPIRSLIEHAFSLEMSNPIYFYWAHAAVEQVPYLDRHAKSWEAIMDDYHYQTIGYDYERNDPESSAALAQKIFDALDGNMINQSDVYISATAEVLIPLAEMLLNHGLDEQQLIASPIE